MTSNPNGLIDGYLDDALTADQQAELSAWIKAKPEHARMFAEAMLLHDRLRNSLITEEKSIDFTLPTEGKDAVDFTLPTEGKDSREFTLPGEGRGGACDDAGRAEGVEDASDTLVPVLSPKFPSPKSRSSTSTLPKEGDDAVEFTLPTEGKDSREFTLPGEGCGGARDDAGRAEGVEDSSDTMVPVLSPKFPSPKSRSSTSTLPREGEDAVEFTLPTEGKDSVEFTLPREGEDVCIESRPVWLAKLWPMSALARTTAAAAAVLVFGLTALWFTIGTSTASAAIRELDRIIVNSMRAKDRIFEIVVEDIARERRGRRFARPELQRPPKPPLDGATLYVRSGNQFVLNRKTQEGLPFITGSNGQQSWAVNPRGPVKVSDDVNEFNRDLPGHESSVPLTNLHEGLEQLKVAYDLTFAALGPEEYQAEDGNVTRQLIAVKKPRERGPQRVEIVYDGATGGILRMRFIQMPYGPDRLDLRLSLVSEEVLPSDFFEHASHHALDRKVEVEN